MPWQERGRGYTKATDDGKGGGFISNVPQYEKLKAKYGKKRAAAITNSFHNKRGPKRKDEMAKAAGDGGASQILVLQGPREPIAKSAPGEFARGIRTGVHLANQGHSPIGPFGSGVAGRKTYTVRPGGSKAKRAGIHLGVAGAQTPALVPVAAVSAAGGAGAVRHHMRKAVDRHDAAAAFLGGGAAGSGTSAVQAHRRARAQRQGSAKLHEEARDHFRIVENRVARQLMKPGTKGALARTTPAMHSTARELFQGRAQDKQASAMARDAITSGRKAKGRAGAAVLLAGGASAAASRRERSPRYSSVGYR